MPITWRNVQQRDSGASQMLDRAVSNIGTGLDRINSVFDQRQGIEQNNRQAAIKQNTNQFRDFVRGFGSPEELQAAKESGAIDEMRQGFGPLLDREATDDFARERISGMQQDALAAHEYDQFQTGVQEAPVIDEILQRAKQGDTQGAMEAAEASGVRDTAGLMAQIQGIGDTQTARERDDMQFAMDREAHRLGIAQTKQSMEQSAALFPHKKNQIIGNNIRQVTEEGKRINERDAYDYATQRVEDNLRQYGQNIEATSEIANDLDIPLGEGGVPIFEEATQDQIDAFEKALGKRAISDPKNSTRLRNDIIDSLHELNKTIEDPDQQLSASRIEAIADERISSLQSRFSLEESEQRELTNQQESLQQQVEAEREASTQSFQQQIENNPYVRGMSTLISEEGSAENFINVSNNPAEALNDIIGDLVNDDTFERRTRNDATRMEQMVDDAWKYLSGGIEVEVGDEKETLPVHPELLKLGMQSVVHRRTPNKHLGDVLKDLLSTPGELERYKEGLTLIDDYREQQRALDDKLATEMFRAEARIKQASGLPVESSGDMRERMRLRSEQIAQEREEQERVDKRLRREAEAARARTEQRREDAENERNAATDVRRQLMHQHQP